MRKIAIVGAGQSGLQLGIGLLDSGYDVTIISNRTPEEIHGGPILSSQVMFDPCLQTERDQGLNFWDDECPWMDILSVAAPGPDGSKLIDWTCTLDKPCQSLDQRIKFPRWMKTFAERGGELTIHEATLEDLESYAENYDLVLVASGKGDIGKLFERDAERCTFDKPQRDLSLMFVKNMRPRDDGATGGLTVVPGIGEYLYFRALTTSGVCDIMLFEAVIGGPMDVWAGVDAPEAHPKKAKELLKTFIPWEAARCENIELTDPKAVLRGRVPPTVREPIGRLPSGQPVLGIGDALILNDPLAGRGANSAAMAASMYLRRILEHEDKPFSEEWMHSVFEEFWDWAQWGVRFTNAQLIVPPEPHLVQVLMTAQHSEPVKRAFVEGFNNSASVFPWFDDPAETDKLLSQHAT